MEADGDVAGRRKGHELAKTNEDGCPCAVAGKHCCKVE